MLTDPDCHEHQAPQHRSTVPYIALRTGEGPVTKELTLELRSADTWGLAYADETPDDRDSLDVLWRRYHQTRDHAGRPTGDPVAGKVHPDRLRETMNHLTCAVCNHPASQTADGYLFLEPPGEEPVEGRLTTWPPVCMDHVITYAHNRPDLRHGYTMIRSADPNLYGVRGRRLRFAGTAFETFDPDAELPYEQAQGRWIIAEKLVRELRMTVAIEHADLATS
ncbi:MULTISPECIES: hypothetical protein [Streptomyces]|uniref:hypothetical protein n=1 Tax=Streptomyces TaxID=1883 RepID=UPI00067D6855|nr:MULTISPECIES: hypothetical protein [Streptomyces]